MRVSLIHIQPLEEKKVSLSGEDAPSDQTEKPVVNADLFGIVQIIEMDDLSEDDCDEDDDEVIFMDNIEKSKQVQTEPESKSADVDDEETSDGEDAQADVQSEDELEEGNEGNEVGFNPELYFNSHKCFLMVGFEIEFLESPVLRKSGIVGYIKEAEIDSEGKATDKRGVSSETDKYKLIELDVKNKKLEEIISLMKQVKDYCWSITSESSLNEFKEEVLDITKIIQSKIHQIDIKLEKYTKITDKRSPEFDPSGFEKNMEKKSRLLGRRSSFQLALTSFTRIEEYWTHLENLPSM